MLRCLQQDSDTGITSPSGDSASGPQSDRTLNAAPTLGFSSGLCIRVTPAEHSPPPRALSSVGTRRGIALPSEAPAEPLPLLSPRPRLGHLLGERDPREKAGWAVGTAAAVAGGRAPVPSDALPSLPLLWSPGPGWLWTDWRLEEYVWSSFSLGRVLFGLLCFSQL